MLNRFSKSGKTAIFVTIYFVLYAILLFAGVSEHIIFLLLIPTPFIIVYLVYVVITDKKEGMRDLKNDEEFSYQDWPGASKPKED
jgi:4-hydroxybenzoate polyprenyltransferase